LRTVRAENLDSAILVMKAAENRSRCDGAEPLNRPMNGSVLAQSSMSPRFIIVGGKLAKDPAQMGVCTENLIRIDCVTESPNVSGDDRALLPLPDPVRLAVQVEEPTWGREHGAPSSTDRAAAQGAGPRPAHKWGSRVLGPAVSMVSIGAQGHHYHPTGDPGALASGRLSPLLALEIPAPLEVGPKSMRTCAR
jgi:hypothetical protein